MSETNRERRVWRAETSDRLYTDARVRRADTGNRRTLRAFVEWLANDRGLARSTIATRICPACAFVDAVTRRSGRPCAASFRSIGVRTIEDIFIKHGKGRGLAWRRGMQSSMRQFLRFAADRGWADAELVKAVPSLLSYRLSHLPQGLDDRQLARLLDPPFRRGLCPRRDWAIVSLLAGYGARRGQVSALLLDDVDWQARTIELRAHKGGKAVRHTLSDGIAEALVAYLRDERPDSASLSVFLRCRLPHERLSPSAITTMVQSRMARRGLPSFGPHALRHTFASRLLRAGQSVKTIADLLGHRSLGSVGVYAKVDTPRLLTVAGEWPEIGR